MQKSKLQGEQIQQLRSELKAAQDGCCTHQRLQAEADRRAGEYLAQLQTRGEYILLLQSQLNDLEHVNTQLREQLASGAAAAAGPGSTANAAPSHAGSGTPGGGSRAPAATSSNGNHAPELQDTVSSAQHEAVVQQLQQQLQLQTEQLQQLRRELANATLATPAAAAAAPSSDGTPAATVTASNGSNSTDDLAEELDTARAGAAAAVREPVSSAAEAAAAALAGLQEDEAKHQQLQQQFDDLSAFVKQLEAQASQREALMGGLLAQVGTMTGWYGLSYKLLLFVIDSRNCYQLCGFCSR